MTTPNPPPIPPKVEAEGLRAYEQVRAFDAIRGRRLPLIYTALSVMLFLASGALIERDQLLPGTGVLLVAILASTVALFHWKRLEARHRTNLEFLASLEMRYGDKLRGSRWRSTSTRWRSCRRS